MLVVFVVALELNATIVELMRHKFEPTTHLYQHRVDSDTLCEANHFVQKLLQGDLEVEQCVGYAPKYPKYQHTCVESNNHISSFCLKLIRSTFGNGAPQKYNCV